MAYGIWRDKQGSLTLQTITPSLKTITSLQFVFFIVDCVPRFLRLPRWSITRSERLLFCWDWDLVVKICEIVGWAIELELELELECVGVKGAPVRSSDIVSRSSSVGD